jgi:hydrogenase nickel incorporation protein HypA/HybF
MSLSQGMLRLIEEQAAANSFSRVRTVRLEIGELSDVEPEAMRFCFDATTRGTVADGSALEIIRVPGRAWCHDCEEAVALGRRHDPCPRCGGHRLVVTGGAEMRLKELEVE